MKMGVFVSDYSQTSDTLERISSAETGMIFVMNGVYHATIKGSKLLDMTKNLFVLAEDLQTRGIEASAVDSRVKVVTYGDVVDLVFNDYEKIAWL